MQEPDWDRGPDQIWGMGGDVMSLRAAGNDTVFAGDEQRPHRRRHRCRCHVRQLGSDTCIVDNVDDVVSEEPDEGTDTVETTLNAYALCCQRRDLAFTGVGDFTGTQRRGSTMSSLAVLATTTLH